MIPESIISLLTDQVFQISIAIIFALVLMIGVYLFSEDILDYVSLNVFGLEEIGSDLKQIFRFPLSLTIGLGILYVLFQTLDFSTNYIEPVRAVIFTIILVIWFKVSIKLGSTLVEPIVANKYEDDLAPIVENIWNVSAIIIILLSLFSVWGINITPILASAGVLGIIAGFAARDTIANFFGSISLYVDNTYRSSDFIRLDDETEGFVQDISIRSTRIRTLDGDVITIPNSKLNSAILENKSQPIQEHRIKTTIGVSYDADPEKVKEILTGVIKQSDHIVENQQSNVFLKDFGDSAVIFELLYYIPRYPDKRMIKDQINSQVYKALDENDIEIPYPQRDIHMNSTQTKVNE